MKHTRRAMKVETYAPGGKVCITGGVHRQCGYVGVVAGETRCYVDVWVPRLGQQLRVHKTSVQATDGAAGKGMEIPVAPVVGSKRLEEGKSSPLRVVNELMAICQQLAELGVTEGDVDLHAIIDAGLRRGHTLCPESREMKDKRKRAGEK